uniref:Uncharacterized protein LOC103929078 n=1 Tax=Rhizophora mucronata TaxID=61149 RepID=A0A2P2M964_RHIMU
MPLPQSKNNKSKAPSLYDIYKFIYKREHQIKFSRKETL